MHKSRWATSPAQEGGDSKTACKIHCTMCFEDHPAKHFQDSSATQPTVSSLSAQAPSFAPTPAETSDSPFAPTGAQQDDLFGDVTPVEESMRLRSDDDLFNDDFTPAAEPLVEPAAPLQAVRTRGDGSRGRGRGRGGASAVAAAAAATRSEARGAPRFPRGGMEGDQQKSDSSATNPATTATPPDNAPTHPRKDTVPAVRGDRQATGGVRPPKLTDAQLAEKMAAIQVKNASLTAAHARAEADAASFAEREEQARQVTARRNREERQDRQRMMGEREKNRLRKLKAMEGREWDAEKREADFDKGGRFDGKRGGFAGDAADYTDGREYLYREPRGGSGGGRGQGNDAARGGRRSDQPAPSKEDFPALPAAKSQQAEPSVSETVAKAMDSSEPPGKSWADQVESSAQS